MSDHGPATGSGRERALAISALPNTSAGRASRAQHRTLALLVLLISFAAHPGEARLDGAGLAPEEATGYAWSENAGWIDGGPATVGVVVEADFLGGFAWGENIGWIKLGADGGGPYANTDASDWGVNRGPTGQLSGFAWSENVGWVDFDPVGGGVTISPTTGIFGGFAWSKNVGWIHLSDPPSYGIFLTQQIFVDGFEGGSTAAWSGAVP